MTDRSSQAASSVIQRELDAAVRERVAPALCLLVGRCDTVLLEACAGHLDYAVDSPEAALTTRYDLSSLTKPLATTALIMRLIAAGGLRLDTRVVDLVPEFGAGGGGDVGLRAAVTVADLLSHRSGLPAHRRYFERLSPSIVGTSRGCEQVVAWAAAETLEGAPGSRAVYSDLGFMLLGEIVRRQYAEPLDLAFERELGGSLGLSASGFVRLGRSSGSGTGGDSRTAPSGWCPWRDRLVDGFVQDENAYAMGGVAGHAGLFSDIRDVHRLVAEHVRAWGGGSSVLEPELVRRFWTIFSPPGGESSTWALGWDTPSSENSSAGKSISRRAVGHLGFTGTSVWIDLDRQMHVILLTNRLQPDCSNTAIRAFRPRLHDAVFEVCS